MKRILIAPYLLSAATAFGQSFNIDFGSNGAANPGLGPPGSTFGGAAGQPGVWNTILSSQVSGLNHLDGSSSGGVLLVRTGSGNVDFQSSSALSGDHEDLLEDFFRGLPGETITVRFENLQPGAYAVYTYAINPASGAPSLVSVDGSTSQSDQHVGGMLLSPNFWIGLTHALHVVETVTFGQRIEISVEPPTPSGTAIIAGLQLVKLDGPRLRIYVDDDALAGDGTGTSWTNAFTHPTAALINARIAGGENCDVWVANGNYKPLHPLDPTNRSFSFDIPNHLHFFGGFVGNETELSQRIPVATLTYLDGNIGDFGTNADNSYAVVDASNCAADTVIDGFRIFNGYANDPASPAASGAGMLLQNSFATVRNCSFVRNEADNQGGAVFSAGGAPTFVKCTFFQNEASEGSALYHAGPGQLRVYNSNFLGNYGNDGTTCFPGSHGLFVGCLFSGNVATDDGGAIYGFGAGSSIIVTNCTLSRNYAFSYGGGARIENGADLYINNSIFWNNAGAQSELLNQRSVDPPTAVQVLHSTIMGSPGAAGENPLFVNAYGADGVPGGFDDDLRLSPGSPCIDAGMNLLVPNDFADVDENGDLLEQLPLDLNRYARFVDDPDTVDTGIGAAPLVDRGAFEFQPCLLQSDVNDDGRVDLRDLSILLANFGATSGAEFAQGDIDGDGDIDLSDLTVLLTEFGTHCS